MRKLFLLFVLLISTALRADEGSIFRDEDSGLVIQIPQGIERTWSLFNHKSNLSLFIFSEELTQKKAIIIATIPMNGELVDISLASLGTSEDFIALFQSDDVLKDAIEEDIVEDFSMVIKDSLAPKEWLATRVGIDGIFFDMSAHGDMHFFKKDNYMTVIATMIIDDEQNPEEFSKSILETVRFIEE